MHRALCALLLAAASCGSGTSGVPRADEPGHNASDADTSAAGTQSGTSTAGEQDGASAAGKHELADIEGPTRPSPWDGPVAHGSDDGIAVSTGGPDCADNGSCAFDAWHEEEEAAANLVEKLLSPRRYNYQRLPPRAQGTPVRVTLDIKIERIGPLKDQSYHIDVYMVQHWMDPRLRWDARQYHGITFLNFLNQDEVDRIWVPGTVFFHATPFEKRPVLRMVVYDSGRVEYTQHFLMSVRCVNKEFAFPFDINYCTLRIGSYIWNKTEVDYKWDRDYFPEFFAKGSWEFDEHKFQNGSLHDYGEWKGSRGASHRQLVAYFQMSRIAARYFWNVYVPVFCVSLIAYCSYWIGPYAAPARATIGVVTVLTCTVQLDHAKKSHDAVQFTALDLYVLFALLFCIFAMTEYAVVNYFLSMAFGMNPPQSALGMRHKHVRAKWRLTQVMLMRQDELWTPEGRSGLMNRLATFRDGRLNALVEGVLGTTRTLSREMLGDFPRQRSDDSDSDCLLDTSWYEDDSPLDDDELLDFFAAADRSLKESLSFEDILSVVDLLAFDEVDEGELRLQFDLAASSGNELKNSHHKGELDLAQFRCFVSKVVSGLNGRGRWPHPPSRLHPSLVIFRRRVTWRLDEEPTMVDSWMRRVMLPVLVLWNLAYVWVWMGKDPVACATRKWLVDSRSYAAQDGGSRSAWS